jgi:Fe2+ transport system protein FeoA|tara:strand:- start:109 stop:465 length:357 start_codon:yes stop_codon:yes gene_type:complete
MKAVNILILLFSILLFSCSSTNNSVTASSEDKAQIVKEKMMEAGFTKGTVVTSKIEGDCPITIKVQGKDASYFLDPINLENIEINEGENIWFKFAGLMMMNRCEKANPISIIEIVKNK